MHIKGSKFWQFSNILTIFGRILSLHMQKKLPIKILILLFLWPPCLYTDIIFLPCGFYFSFFLSAKLCGIEQRAPPIFRRAAITLGIGPHSSFYSAPHCKALYYLQQFVPFVCPSVRPSVHHRPVLCQNDGT